jgi:hypothetical protein
LSQHYRNAGSKKYYGDKGVFSLDDAYLNKVVDIGHVYSLYLDGIISDTRGLKSITS